MSRACLRRGLFLESIYYDRVSLWLNMDSILTPETRDFTPFNDTRLGESLPMRNKFLAVCLRCCCAATIFGFACAAAGVGQSVPTTPSPPGHLPALIGECEAGPNYNACSVWIWHGSSYSAIWQNGAVGQLVVDSGDSSNLRINRQDSAGPVAGLTATYTGKWDGKSFSDGTMTATLKGGTNRLTWTGTPAVTPVLPNPQMDHSYVNWYPAQLTAYAIYRNQGSFNMSVGTEINDYRMRGEPPMNPGDSRLFTLKYTVVPANYVNGAKYPQASTIAAIYTDGTTFGDANVLKAMLEQRKLMIAALTSIGTTLCAMGQQGASIQDISAALDKQHAAEDARSQVGKEERNSAYSRVQKEIAHNVNSRTPSRAIQQIANQANQMRTGLTADPVKDGGGNLLISPATPLACNLP